MKVNRTQIYHFFSEQEFDFGEVNGYEVAIARKQKNGKQEKPNGLSLCDVTAINRIGYKGSDIESWCKKQYNVTCPTINRASRIENGIIVARLSGNEVLLLEDIDNDLSDTFSRENYPDTYTLPRQYSHHCFLLKGERSADVFAKLCSVDLRTKKFQNMQVSQMILARVSAIIIRRDIKGNPAYLVLVDSSVAEYMWNCFLEAILEFDGYVDCCETMSKINAC